MIDELKLVLDTIGDISGVAIWVVAAFFIFKIIIYLSTTGAIVFLVRLAITSLHDFLTREQTVKHDIGRYIIDGKTKDDLMDLIDEVKRTPYLHRSDVGYIKTAVKEKKDREEVRK